MSAAPSTRSGGPRILVVEDEYFIASMVRDCLADEGFDVPEPQARLSPALRAAAAGGWDAAIVDLDLRGELAYPVLDALHAAGTPVLVITGYVGYPLPQKVTRHPILGKPFSLDGMISTLRALLAAPLSPSAPPVPPPTSSP